MTPWPWLTTRSTNINIFLLSLKILSWRIFFLLMCSEFKSPGWTETRGNDNSSSRWRQEYREKLYSLKFCWPTRVWIYKDRIQDRWRRQSLFACISLKTWITNKYSIHTVCDKWLSFHSCLCVYVWLWLVTLKDFKMWETSYIYVWTGISPHIWSHNTYTSYNQLAIHLHKKY